MKNTTLVLAFCATLTVSSIAAALVVINQQPSRKPAKRKGETEVATRVYTPEVLRGKAVVDSGPVVSKPESKPELGPTVAKPEATVTPETRTQPIVEAEPVPEVITEYYPSGKVKAVYRGYRHKDVNLSVVWSSAECSQLIELSRENVFANNKGEIKNEIIESQKKMFQNGETLEAQPQVRLYESIEKVRSDNTDAQVGTIALELPATRHGLYESYYENGQIESRGEFNQGSYSGYWAFWHENGQVRECGEYFNASRHGHWTSYNANGLRTLETDWHNGVEHGMHTEWYDNGTMAATGMMKNGQKDGYWTYWTSDGAKLREGDYENGAEKGEWREYQLRIGKLTCKQELREVANDDENIADESTETVIK